MTVARSLAALIALAAVLPTPVAHGAPGDLDVGFGTGGTLVAPVGTADGQAYGLALAPDGDILVTGDATVREPDESGAGARQLLLARFGPFGDHRRTTFFPAQDPPADTGGVAVAALPDGRALTAGSLLVPAEGRQAGLVAMHGPDGELDPGYGNAGWMSPAFDLGTATGIAAFPDGSALLSGATLDRGELVKLLPDGTGDPAYGTNGLAQQTSGGRFERYNAVAVLPGGGAAVAGTAASGDTDLVQLVARFATDGSLQQAVDVPFPEGTVTGDALVALPDGSVVTAGTAGNGADADWAFAKVRADGTLDPAFGDGGRAKLPLSASEDRAFALAPAPGGKLVAGGLSTSEDGARLLFTVARLTADGRRDPTFGDGGVVRVPLPGDVAVAYGVAVLPDGAVLAAGSAQRDGRTVLALARLQGDGPAPPLATSDPPPPPGATPVPAAGPPRGRFTVRLLSRRIERGNTLRVRVRWPRGWRGAARIRITRVRSPQLLIASRRVQGRGGRGRVFRVKVTRLGRDALLGVRRTRVRTELLPSP